MKFFGTTWEWTLRSIRRRGLLTTCKVAASHARDLLFDLRYGTDTMSWVEVEALDTSSENKSRAVRYQPTKARPLASLLTTLKLPVDCTFLDIGSGKGRALLIAAQYGFKRVVGVEFSSKLCELAKKNVQILAPRLNHTKVEILECDVADYMVRADQCVFYLYNPFDAVVLRRVLRNIEVSLQQLPRKIWLIYNTPNHHDVISECGIFQSSSWHEVSGTEFRVYYG